MRKAIIEKIKKEIESLDGEVKATELGVVSSVGDGVAVVDGLNTAQMMEMVIFSPDAEVSLQDLLNTDQVLYGLVLNLEEDSVKIMILGNTVGVYEGMKVYRTNKLLSIPVS